MFHILSGVRVCVFYQMMIYIMHMNIKMHIHSNDNDYMQCTCMFACPTKNLLKFYICLLIFDAYMFGECIIHTFV